MKDAKQHGITREQAVELHDSEFWKTMSFKDRANFQMFTKRLCMPFDVFHEAVEKTLGRPVFTHEFDLDWDGLAKELCGERDAPSFTNIISLIPEDKQIMLVVCDG